MGREYRPMSLLPVTLLIVLGAESWAQPGRDFRPTRAEWSEIGSGLPRTIAAVTSLVIDSATPSTLYAVDSNGRLFKSIDSGWSWNSRGSVVGVSFAVVDPTNSSTMYAATS